MLGGNECRRAKLHADVAHPINAACRERIQNAVIEAFQAELERAKSPDYKPPKYDDFDEDTEEMLEEQPVASAPKPARKPAAVETADEDPVAFGDYNSLIADLKREAADRREKHDEKRGWRPEPAEQLTVAEQSMSDDEPEVEKPRQEQYSRPTAPPPRAPSPPPPPPPRRRDEEQDDFSAGL